MFGKFLKNIPQEVKTISWYTSIFYFWRWFAEAFIPVFLFSFANSYAQTWMLKSIYDIVFFVAAPVAWYLADRVSTRKMILIWLCFYPLISINYFFAWVSSIAIFIVIARILNWISYSLMWVGRGTYIYHYAKWKIATSLWFFDSLVNRSWIISLCISMVLVKRIPLHFLFLAIIPGSIVAFFVAKKLPEIKKDTKKFHINFGIYKNIFQDIKTWKPKLRILMLLGTLIIMVSTAFIFFVPIEIYQNSHNLYQIAIFAIILTIPEALWSLFGHKVDVDHGRWFIFSCIAIFVLLVVSLFLTQFWRYLIAVFVLWIALEIIEMERSKLIAKYWESESYGNINWIKLTLDEGIWTILWPVIIWMCIDVGGLNLWFGIMIGLICTILYLFIWKIMPIYIKGEAK